MLPDVKWFKNMHMMFNSIVPDPPGETVWFLKTRAMMVLA